MEVQNSVYAGKLIETDWISRGVNENVKRSFKRNARRKLTEDLYKNNDPSFHCNQNRNCTLRTLKSLQNRETCSSFVLQLNTREIRK